MRKPNGLLEEMGALIELAEREDSEALELWELRGASGSLENKISKIEAEWTGDESVRSGPPLRSLPERRVALAVMMKAMCGQFMSRLWGNVLVKLQSPIEELFFYGLVFASWEAGADVVVGEERGTGNIRLDIDNNYDNYRVVPQKNFGRLHPDFWIRGQFSSPPECSDPLGAEVVVECDGHGFHEKTKEQARRDKARDRDLHAMGCPVIRFTGSELVANPIEKGRWVVDHIRHLAHRPLWEARFRKNGANELNYWAKQSYGGPWVERKTGWTLEEWATRIGIKWGR